MNQSIRIGTQHQLTPLWSSASDAVATVDQTGLVTAVALGTAEIYCTVGGLSVAAIITVTEPEIPPEDPNV